MPLRQKRRIQRPGLPELVALAFVLVAIGAALAWLNAAAAPALEQTTGRVVSCDIRPTHYNAADVLSKVFVDYVYNVGIGTYTGHWEGTWPATDSPDALPPEDLDLLKSHGRSVTVFYDPANPRASLLHNRATRYPALYALAAAATTLAALIYLVRIYPAWKR
jgi:hypothetical protein